jgi:hypothetical protein
MKSKPKYLPWYLHHFLSNLRDATKCRSRNDVDSSGCSSALKEPQRSAGLSPFAASAPELARVAPRARAAWSQPFRCYPRRPSRATCSSEAHAADSFRGNIRRDWPFMQSVPPLWAMFHLRPWPPTPSRHPGQSRETKRARSGHR